MAVAIATVAVIASAAKPGSNGRARRAVQRPETQTVARFRRFEEHLQVSRWSTAAMSRPSA